MPTRTNFLGVQSTNITKIVQITQAAYTALGSPDPGTFYLIVG